jgi:hypothetical protein
LLRAIIRVKDTTFSISVVELHTNNFVDTRSVNSLSKLSREVGTFWSPNCTVPSDLHAISISGGSESKESKSELH